MVIPLPYGSDLVLDLVLRRRYINANEMHIFIVNTTYQEHRRALKG